jgi:hypothetical protein
MGWTPLRQRLAAKVAVFATITKRIVHAALDIIGIDLAKNVFQLHGASQTGAVLFQKKLSRGKLLMFLAAQPPCTVAMEACASAHFWGRQISTLGHTVRLIAPNYVKPFVKRQKNDAADAQAICEAAHRPTMRFVAVKSEEKQASTMVFKARDLLVRQRNQIINALRGHLTEFGIIAPQGPRHIHTLIAAVDDPATDLHEAARSVCWMLITASVSWTGRSRSEPGRTRRSDA